MIFARSHDRASFVVYFSLDNSPPSAKSYAKFVLNANRAQALRDALNEYLKEQSPPDPVEAD
jgi:hypothetical protein